jgi:hypothetical protein
MRICAVCVAIMRLVTPISDPTRERTPLGNITYQMANGNCICTSFDLSVRGAKNVSTDMPGIITY